MLAKQMGQCGKKKPKWDFLGLRGMANPNGRNEISEQNHCKTINLVQTTKQ